jgi:hypothetical protein
MKRSKILLKSIWLKIMEKSNLVKGSLNTSLNAEVEALSRSSILHDVDLRRVKASIIGILDPKSISILAFSRDLVPPFSPLVVNIPITKCQWMIKITTDKLQ